MFSLTVPNMAAKITRTIFRDREVDEDRFAIVKYGVEIFLVNVTKGITVYLLAIILGVFFESLLVHMAYLFVRRHSFGLHARTSVGCTFMSLIVFAVIPYVFQGVVLSNSLIIFSSAFILLNISLYSPSDTENMPLFNAQKRHKLRVKSIFNTMIVIIFVLLLPWTEVKICLLYGALIQTIMIHPWSYKLLRRRYNNYEKE